MAEVIQIALVGDFDATVPAHRAIPEALGLSAKRLGVKVAPIWVQSASIGSADRALLSDFTGVWCVPGSPYASMTGALGAIRFARESGRPFLGSCGGFQHAVLEYARNVLGHSLADHAETCPNTTMPLISRLTCGLIEETGVVVFQVGSRLHTIYGMPQAVESYHCNYGLNPDFESLFPSASGLCICARDVKGEARAVELTEHPFFIGTLFQPERSALRRVEHPLITAFVQAAGVCCNCCNDNALNSAGL